MYRFRNLLADCRQKREPAFLEFIGLKTMRPLSQPGQKLSSSRDFEICDQKIDIAKLVQLEDHQFEAAWCENPAVSIDIGLRPIPQGARVSTILLMSLL